MRIFFYFRLLILIVIVGIPLWIKEKLTGSQEGKLMNLFCKILMED